MNSVISSDLAIHLKNVGYFIQHKHKYSSFSRYNDAIDFCKSYPNKLNDDSFDILGDIDNEGNMYSCRIILNEFDELPTISDVVMWIYKKYGFWIEVSKISGYLDLFFYTITGSNGFNFGHKITVVEWDDDKCDEMGYNNKYENSPTEAYEAAIEYCLNNLINQ